MPGRLRRRRPKPWWTRRSTCSNGSRRASPLASTAAAFAYNWTADPWARGSYAAFLPGQTTRFAPIIKRPEGGIHFAGEHTSVAFQGFLEGAVVSGERAAREVLAAR